MRCTEPEALRSETLPPLPTLATTRLDTVWPGTEVSAAVLGRLSLHDALPIYELAVGWVAVTLSTTAPTPVAGTPATPVTGRSMLPPAPMGTVGAPMQLGGLRMRVGSRGP